MNATEPTVMEQATIDRLGIFDEEKFAEIVAHGDDAVACEHVRCGSEASWRISLRCCGLGGSLCDSHLQAARDGWVEASADGTFCEGCGHEYPASTPFDDVFRVVPL